MKLKVLFLSIIAFGFASSASAQGLSPSSISSITGAYRFYKNISNISITVPTVVEVPFTNEFMERFNFAVLDEVVNLFEPHFLKQETRVDEIPVSVSANSGAENYNLMNDNDTQTYADFPLPDDGQGVVQITLNSVKPIVSSAVTTILDDNVALPNLVEIRALVGGQDKIVVANQKMEQQTVNFPKTTSNKWTIKLTFGQPLRISELRLYQNNAVKTNSRAIRFLAQPNHSYRVYFDPDRTVSSPVGEAGNLASEEDVLIVPATQRIINSDYIISDIDDDRIPDIRDNCVYAANFDQQDVNKNGRGDVCDDFDKDGITNAEDNCPDNPNWSQSDEDSDGIGDICDEEESRMTERYTWIPWLGIGFAAIVLVVLLVLTARTTRVKN
ncbi:MAG: thrombospondin type 3 repeat-containing protein [Candidatus Magasanikbacteria bacterium]|nr:thrombospondin type 3 repeat-containing protein [Candidatus Magasanikbacteria bacterium]